MKGKFFLGWVVAFVLWMAGGFIVHGTLLAADYKLTNLFRRRRRSGSLPLVAPGAHLRGRRLRLDLFARHRGEALARSGGPLRDRDRVSDGDSDVPDLLRRPADARIVVVRQIVYDVICLVIVGIAIAWVYRRASARRDADRIRHFASPAAFGRWLETPREKVRALGGVPQGGDRETSLTWSESVDEALCWGWIDGVRKSVDASRSAARSTPATGPKHLERRRHPQGEGPDRGGTDAAAGLAAFRARRGDRSGVYSFERGRQRSSHPSPNASSGGTRRPRRSSGREATRAGA